MPDDRAAIEDVLYAYADLVDRARLDDLMDLFTEDAVLDYGHGRVFTGRDTMRGLFADRLLAVYRATSHHISNVRIEVEDDRARATCHVYAWHERADDGATPQVWGRYLDDLVRTEDGWRIARRVIRAAGEQGFPVPDGLPSAFERIDRDGD
jgi:ketosteroid isomerase-like protein